jgi:biopolymer transport protein ExbB
MPKIDAKSAALVLLLALAAPSHAAESWWNKEWAARKSFTIDTGASGVPFTEPPGTSLVLIRLHGGNFNFAGAREDGSDIRFVATDDKTILDHQIEKYDTLLNEAYVWVKVPDLKAGEQTKFWLYSGNGAEKIEEVSDPKATFDADTVLVYHFGGSSTPVDATKNANNATTGGTLSEGALIAGGMRLLGNTAIKIPASDSLKRNDGDPITWSGWIKSTAKSDRGVIFQMVDGAKGFEVGLANGVPYVEIRDAAGRRRSPAGEPLADSVWKHLAVVATNASTTLYVDGKEYAKLDSPIPGLSGAATLGADADGTSGAVGEIDEIEISKTARGAGWVKFAATSQAGGDASNKLVVPGEDESGTGGGGENEMLKHLALFGDIAKNMMFDGWIAIGVCVIMMIAGWSVAIGKYLLLGRIRKGNEKFLEQWKEVATDLTVMDTDDNDSAKSFGGKASKKAIKLMHDSPLYHVYQIGAGEIRHRLGDGKNAGQGLSARSIQAIRASLDAGLVHEHHRLNKGIVMLTMSIAGGPYVGLLGTVVGVMITFAIIAKSGNVEVNSIAPGIASALLATVVGLLVAIPALFMYSFLSSGIKEALSSMQVFIDEFIAKVAEFYPTPGEATLPVPIKQIRSPEEAARAHEATQSEIAEQSRNK